MNYAFNITCVDGMPDGEWGRTGQKGWLIVYAPDEDTAKTDAAQVIPGGWTAKFLGETTKRPGLHPTGGHL